MEAGTDSCVLQLGQAKLMELDEEGIMPLVTSSNITLSQLTAKTKVTIFGESCWSCPSGYLAS